MKSTFLEAAVPLTKTFSLENGQLKKEGHPRIINYTSHEVEWETLEELYEAIVEHADKGHCFLKGEISRPLVNEPRAGTTDPNKLTRLILLDLDGVKDVDNVDALLKHLGMGDVDYIVQYSSSMGVVPERGLSAHVFVLLDNDAPPSVLKQWLMGENMRIPVLRQNLGLTRTNNALRWTLDVTTCQNDKLIYIAPPRLGPGVKDGFKGKRIQLVKRKRRTFSLPQNIPTAEANKVASENVLNSLREKIGLPKRPKTSMKSHGPIEYMAKPDQAVVTGVKTERGFVYLNINGGDSWGYYHPENNPAFILNFKGEPAYKTSELLPDYWSQVRESINEPKFSNEGVMYLAFRDFRTAGYWNGTWDKRTQILRIAQAKSADQLGDFLKQHGQPMGDFVPDWDLKFDPHSDVIVDPENRTVNLFQPSMYMRMKPAVVTEVPSTIRKIIFHAIGEDEESYEHFMNWFATIVQHRVRTGTAWVFHGTQGTGKGLMLDRVLRPILGADYVVSKRMEELDSQFNGYMERCLLLFVDEAQASSFSRKDVMDSNFKNYITEPKISIRRMHTMPYEVSNYMNMVFASNKDDVVVIDPGDRRFNVGTYQEKQLDISDVELRQVDDELVDFYGYLMTREADKDKARRPLNNSAKQRMIHIGQASIDAVCNAVLSGDFQFFWEQRPDGLGNSGNTSRDIIAGAYVRLLEEIKAGKRPTLSRDELHTLFEYALGGMPQSPYKFTSLLKHHRLVLETVSHSGKSVRGVKVKWRLSKE